MDNLKILQVVGYKNSGKTNFIESFVKKLSAAGKDVAVIKHHGHINGLQQPDSNTDSMKFFHAGAKLSIAVDNETIQLHKKLENMSLNKIITWIKIFDPDLLLIEGYKQEDFEKIVIVRELQDWVELKQLKNIVCVLTHGEYNIDFPRVFSIYDERGILDWLYEWIGEQRKKPESRESV